MNNARRRAHCTHMKHISIEPATVDSAAECAAVFRTTRQFSLAYLPCLHTADEDALFLAERVFGVDTVAVALDETRRVVGFIAFRDGWVSHLYVLPGFQGLGVGARLLGEAKREWASLRLWTFERNTGARRFYEREGFSIVGRTDGAQNEEREPDLLLQWTR